MSKTFKKPMIKIHNTETNEIIEREMNNEEFAIYQISENERNETNQILANAAAEKATLLARLGLTEDELKTILG